MPAIERGADAAGGRRHGDRSSAAASARARSRRDRETRCSADAMSRQPMIDLRLQPRARGACAPRRVQRVCASVARAATGAMDEVLALARRRSGCRSSASTRDGARSRGARAACIRASWPTSTTPRDYASTISSRGAAGAAADRRARRHRGSAQCRRDPADGRRGRRARRRASDAARGGARRRRRQGVGRRARRTCGSPTVVNIARAIEELKEAGVWTVGLAGEAADALRPMSI